MNSDTKRRRSILILLSGAFLAGMLAATVIHLAVQRSIEQEQFRQRREALQDLSKRAIILPAPPPSPFKLLASREG